jgi:hypothetical protein
MRAFIAPVLCSAVLLVTGCRRESPAPPASGPARATPSQPAPPAELQLRFAGAAALATNEHTGKLREIAALPAVREQWKSALDKLASTAPEWSGGSGTGQPDATRLRPLLEDLWQHGFAISWTRKPDGKTAWRLTLDRSPEIADLWRRNLSAWLAPGEPAAIRSTAEGWEKPDEAGGWRFDYSEGVVRISRGDAESVPSPAAAGGESWLTLAANPPGTAVLNGLARELVKDWGGGQAEATKEPAAVHWPALDLALTSRDEHVRTRLALRHAQPVRPALRPWQVPTNTIHDPLISFSAMQAEVRDALRVLPWLGPQDALARLGLPAAPEQLYVWGMGEVPFQSFVAFPLPDPTNALARLAENLRERWSDKLEQRSLGRIHFDTDTARIAWQGGLPILAPTISPAADQGYVVAGVFPSSATARPPPAELISQVTGRTNLLYYHWEITQGRALQWKVNAQFLEMARLAAGTTAAPGSTGPPAMGAGFPAWLDTVAEHLGNSVTEIVVDSPTEWLLTRKSHTGLTGVELVLLARWLAAPDFPRLHSPAPAPTATNAVAPPPVP